MTNLRVELDSVDFLVWIFNGCKWTVSRSTSADKVSRNFCNSISMAHQDQLFIWCAGKKSRRFCQSQFRLTIFAVTSITCRNDLPAQFMGQQLHSVTDSKDWNTEFENFRIDIKRTFLVYRVWSA